MDKEKETEPKKLQVRLPNDEYVKLKYLAAHHGNSMNSEVLAAINLAEKEARKTGLYIPAEELSTTEVMRSRFTSPLREMLENYVPLPSITSTPEQNVHKFLADWLTIHAELRSELFALGSLVESMDRLIRSIQQSEYAFEAEANPAKELTDLQRVLLKTGGFPALRDAYGAYIQQISALMPKIKNVESVNEGLTHAVQLMRQKRSDQANER